MDKTMVNNVENLEKLESPEAKAEEELLKLGLQTVPENIEAVLELQKILQHPEGSEDITTGPKNVEELKAAMQRKGIKKVVHFEGQSVWIHTKLAIRLAEFMDIPEGKKADLKLIMLYHDLGKTDPELINRPINIDIARRDKAKGKLFQPKVGHANEKLADIEAGFAANGISGRKLEIFMAVVKNHMNQLDEIGPVGLVKMFEGFGETDEEKEEAARMLALAQEVDGNATMYAEITDDGEIKSLKKENTTGKDFEKIWEKYLVGKSAEGAD